MTVRERNIQLPMEQIEAFCRRHPIRKLSLFGSVLGERFRDDSDVDFLVEFIPGKAVGLITLMGMQFELEEIVGRKADLRTPGDLHERFRDRVVSEAELLYALED
jgi:predicted nucleotidyltransferase